MHSAYYNPEKAAKKYREVIRPKKGHVAGGQGVKRGTIPMTKDERGSLLILQRIDRHIWLTDARRILDKVKHRGDLRSEMRHKRGREPLYTPDERGAIRAHFKLKLSTRRCRVCGNDRTKNADIDGRCCACIKRRRPAKRRNRIARLRATGQWKILHQTRKRSREARIRNAPGSGITAKQWQAVLDFYGHRCLKCGKSEVTLDHVIPLSLGGHHDPLNAQPLCHLCNSVKSATIADYRPCPFMAYA